MSEEIKIYQVDNFGFDWMNGFEFGGCIYQALRYTILNQIETMDMSEIKGVFPSHSVILDGIKRVVRIDYKDSHQFVFLTKEDSLWKVVGMSNKLKGPIEPPNDTDVFWFL